MVTLQVTLSDETFARFKRLSEVTGLDLETILNAMPLLATSLLRECDTTPLHTLTDEAVMALADTRMETTQSLRLSQLHTQQNAGHLSVSEQEELQLLMGVYQAGQLRKAEAMVEAVRRGLRAKGPA
jgi:hypothetical protein